MPELPDLTVYQEALAARLIGHRFTGLRLGGPFVLRTVEPPAEALVDRAVEGASRLGKRLVVHLSGAHFLVLHLMVAGRLKWAAPGAPLPKRGGLAALDFEPGTVLFTEASGRKRASLHLVRGAEALAALDPGGVEPLQVDAVAFAVALTRERHTLKRALTDPRLVAGIGGAYADEILHRARLSPVQRTDRLDPAALTRLHAATRAVLTEWTDRLRRETEAAGGWPSKVTAFRAGMAVHGRYRQPCPVCGTPVARIRYASNETDYCPRCQTGGRVLADRALSRLLKEDWPRTPEALEERLSGPGQASGA